MSHVKRKMGLLDPDLGSPEHDRIMYELENFVQSQIILRHQFNTHGGKFQGYEIKIANSSDEEDIEFCKLIKANLAHLAGEPPPNKSSAWVEWEMPINRNQTPIAFIDMVIHGVCEKIVLEVNRKKVFGDATMQAAIAEGCFARKDRSGWVIYSSKWHVNKTRGVLSAFEVKPKVTSVGELLRQMKRYRILQPANEWVAVCPSDPAMEAVLRTEGFVLLPLEQIRSFLASKSLSADASRGLRIIDARLDADECPFAPEWR